MRNLKSREANPAALASLGLGDNGMTAWDDIKLSALAGLHEHSFWDDLFVRFGCTGPVPAR